MNMDFLYIIGMIILSFLVFFGFLIFVSRTKLESKDIEVSIDLTKTILMLIKASAKEMGLGNEHEINKIGEIVIDSLEYIKTIPNSVSKEDKINNGIFYVKELCESFNIELNEEKEYIIIELFKLGFNLLDSVVINKKSEIV